METESIRQGGQLQGGTNLEEILALLIGSGTKNLQVFQIAAVIVARLRSGVVFSDAIHAVAGVGKAVQARLLAAEKLSGALLLAENGNSLLSVEEVASYCHWLALVEQEHFIALYLDTHLKVIRSHIISVGTVSASLVHPREAFREGIRYGASAVVFVHNHPSGDVTPSEADYTTTKQLVLAGNYLAIPVVDHVIVAGANFLSLKVSRPSLFW